MEKYRYLNTRDLIDYREKCIYLVNPQKQYRKELLKDEEKQKVIKLLIKKLQVTYKQANYILTVEKPKNLIEDLLAIEEIKDDIPSYVYMIEGKFKKHINMLLLVICPSLLIILMVDFMYFISEGFKLNSSLLSVNVFVFILFVIALIYELLYHKDFINLTNKVKHSNIKNINSKIYDVKLLINPSLGKHDKSSLIYGFKIKLKENEKFKYLIFSNLKYERHVDRWKIKKIEKEILNKLNENKQYEFKYYDKANLITSSNINLDKLIIKL